MSARDKILSLLKNVPALPLVATRVLQRLQDPDGDLLGLTRMIEYDAGLTTNILRMVNSAYFGSPRSIDSIHEAIIRLGTQRLSEIIISSAVGPLIQAPIKGYDLPMGDLWIHSAAVAIGARELAMALKIQEPNYLFTAALLHDVGKIVLGNFAEIDARPILDLVNREQIPFEAAEQQVLDIDHAEVGACLLELWNLPPWIVDVARWHHHPDGLQGDRSAVDLVHFADILCLMCGIGAGIDGLNYQPSVEAVSRLGISVHISEAVIVKILSGVVALRDMFSASAGR